MYYCTIGAAVPSVRFVGLCSLQHVTAFRGLEQRYILVINNVYISATRALRDEIYHCFCCSDVFKQKIK